MDAVPDDDLKDFFDVFFGLILDAQITSIDEFFPAQQYQKIAAIVNTPKPLTEQEKKC